MASFKSSDRNPEAEGDRLRQRFRSVSRRVEWRYRLREGLWWATVCAVAMAAAFAAVALLWLAV